VTLRRRLRALEQTAGIGDGFTVITVKGGFPDPAGEYARAREMKQGRRDGETSEQFRARAIAEAREAGRKFIVFGGLPR
jgi:hypothetical protein